VIGSPGQQQLMFYFWQRTILSMNKSHFSDSINDTLF
jgi:hypothetical protein